MPYAVAHGSLIALLAEGKAPEGPAIAPDASTSCGPSRISSVPIHNGYHAPITPPPEGSPIAAQAAFLTTSAPEAGVGQEVAPGAARIDAFSIASIVGLAGPVTAEVPCKGGSHCKAGAAITSLGTVGLVVARTSVIVQAPLVRTRKKGSDGIPFTSKGVSAKATPPHAATTVGTDKDAAEALLASRAAGPQKAFPVTPHAEEASPKGVAVAGRLEAPLLAVVTQVAADTTT